MAIIQLNTCIKKDLAVDYYTIVKFLEKVCEDVKDVKLNHVEINSGYSIYNMYTLYSITPCIINDNNTYSTSTLLVLIDNETKKIVHCTESSQSFMDVDKYFETLLKENFKINTDSSNYLKLFIKNNIMQKKNELNESKPYCCSVTLNPINNNSSSSSNSSSTNDKLNDKLVFFDSFNGVKNNCCFCLREKYNNDSAAFKYIPGEFNIENLPTMQDTANIELKNLEKDEIKMKD